MIHSRIISTGSYLPDRRVTNAELTQFPPATLPLIEQKTGVRARHYAAEGQCTSDLAAQAALRCLERAGLGPKEVDCLIVATSSPDRLQPPTASDTQHKLGATRAFAYDINSVCSGGVYALHLADCMIKSGSCQKVLVVAAECYSRILNPTDFSTAPYFGDGAGAALLSASDRPGLSEAVLGTDGAGADVIQVPGGGTKKPCHEITDKKDAYFQMNGRAVFEFAARIGTECVKALLVKAGLEMDQIKYVLSHQANVNILKALSEGLGIPMDRLPMNLERYGNTAAASVLLLMDEVYPTLSEGDKVVLVAFGGGLSWGALAVEK